MIDRSICKVDVPVFNGFAPPKRGFTLQLTPASTSADVFFQLARKLGAHVSGPLSLNEPAGELRLFAVSRSPPRRQLGALTADADAAGESPLAFARRVHDAHAGDVEFIFVANERFDELLAAANAASRSSSRSSSANGASDVVAVVTAAPAAAAGATAAAAAGQSSSAARFENLTHARAPLRTIWTAQRTRRRPPRTLRRRRFVRRRFAPLSPRPFC